MAESFAEYLARHIKANKEFLVELHQLVAKLKARNAPAQDVDGAQELVGTFETRITADEKRLADLEDD